MGVIRLQGNSLEPLQVSARRESYQISHLDKNWVLRGVYSTFDGGRKSVEKIYCRVSFGIFSHSEKLPASLHFCGKIDTLHKRGENTGQCRNI